MWLDEQVEWCALGRDVGQGPHPLQPQLVRLLKPYQRKAPRSRPSITARWGQRTTENLSLTSALPFNDGWHLRDWNCTLLVWHAFPYFQWDTEEQMCSCFKALSVSWELPRCRRCLKCFSGVYENEKQFHQTEKKKRSQRISGGHFCALISY